MDTDKKILQARLHTATRTQHTSLNKTILARLPLCLPPHTSSPEAYYIGLLLFSHIYTTLELTTLDVLHNTATDSRTRSILRPLQTSRLARSTALQHDLQRLLVRLRLSAHPPHVVRQAETLTCPIATTITAKPHLALAYAWTMYLALFNGGRYIQRALLSHSTTNACFWTGDNRDGTHDMSSDSDADSDYLTFWHFDSLVPDAEDIKSAFKQQFDLASAVLTDDEQQEVADEGKRCFDLCAHMIAWLDGYMLSSSRQQRQQKEKEEDEGQDERGRQSERCITPTSDASWLSGYSTQLFSNINPRSLLELRKWLWPWPGPG